VLSARPYAYLDDAPLEERRTQAVMSRRWMDPQSASDIGKLDPAAIARVREEAWPDAGTADQLHDALTWLTFMTAEEMERQPMWPGLCQDLITQRRVTKLSVGQSGIFVATERVPYFQSLFPDVPLEPQIVVPPAYAAKRERDESFIEIVRGRLEGLGPTTAQALAESFGSDVEAVDAALLALEAEGTAMRGSFEQKITTTQWCDRRLLARIHRYTVKRLRAEIEPVQARDYLRFLFDWQRVTTNARMQGPDAVPAVLAQLEGFDAPAGAWETEILPTRIAEYEPAWLDEQCLAGRIIWTRLATRAGDSERGASPVRSTPIALLPRRNVKQWSQFAGSIERSQLTDKAQRVAEYIDEHGASFYDEIVDQVGLLPVQVEEALGELVALGLVNSDSFGGLRALLMPADRRRASARDRRRQRRVAIFGMQDAGRWALVKRKETKADDTKRVPPRNDEAVEHICRTLLKRWGVVFWKLLEREADWLPPWRDLLMCLRRLEARGEIRGGRFVNGFSGEQFALPEAIGQLREVRRRENSMQLVSLSAADPLNLIGIVTPGGRLPALTGNRVLYRDGVPVALYVGGEVKFIEQLDPAEQWQARGVLLRRQVPAPLADLA
ncbi:MAG: ATP-dependent DNA helicase, partial [Steroidobacter sp.]